MTISCIYKLLHTTCLHLINEVWRLFCISGTFFGYFFFSKWYGIVWTVIINSKVVRYLKNVYICDDLYLRDELYINYYINLDMIQFGISSGLNLFMPILSTFMLYRSQCLLSTWKITFLHIGIYFFRYLDSLFKVLFNFLTRYFWTVKMYIK